MPGQNSKTILLVEDEALIALGDKRILEKDGYNVIHTFSGEDAVELVYAEKETIDLVLMDIDLGRGMDGTEAAKKILQSYYIPILFRSSHTEKEIVNRTEEITSYGYVLKNSDPTVLFASIKMAFKLHAAHHQIMESEERYRTLVEHSPDGLGIHNNGKILYANPALAKILRAKSMDEIYARPVMEWVHPDYRAIVQERIKRSIEQNLVSPAIEEKFLTLDGQAIDVEVIATPIQYAGEPATQVIVHDITERKQAENKLATSESMLKEAQKTAHIGHWVWNLQTNSLTWSDEIFEIFGVDPQTFTVSAENFEKAIHPDDLALFLSRRGNMLTHKNDVEIGHRIIRPSGEIRYVLERSRTVTDENNEAIYITGTVQDVTERKITENALLQNEERYRQFIDLSFEAIYRTEFDHPIDTSLPIEEQIDAIYENAYMAECNQALVDMYHLPSIESLIGTRLIDAHQGKDNPVNRRSFRKLIENGYQSTNDETFEYTADGQEIWFLSNTIGIVKNGKLTRLWGTSIDITERKRAEAARREAEERWQFALEGAGDGVWDWNLQTNQVFFSRQWKTMLGYDEREIKDSVDEWRTRVHPDDLEETLLKMKEHLDGNTPLYESEHRVRCKNGKYIWILDRGKIITWDDAKKPLRMIGTHRDITHRKERQQEIQHQRDFATQVMSLLGQGLTITNENGVFEFVNPAYAKMVGRQPKDLIGKHPADVTAPEHRSGLASQRRKRITGEIDTYESRLQHVDGSTVPVLITGVPRDDQLHYKGAIAVITDLSKQKEHEAQIESLLHEKELLLKEVHHRIKNNMNTMISILNLHSDIIENDSARVALNDAVSRLYSMMVLYDKLYRSENFGALSAKEYIPSLLNEIVSIFPKKSAITLQMDIDDISLPYKILSPVGIILNELFTNIMKHAFPGDAKGTITVTAKQEPNGIRIIVDDTGIGLPNDFTFKSATGFGMQLISLLVQQLDGKISLEQEGGSRFVIELPLPDRPVENTTD